jgi:hypothetical protein
MGAAHALVPKATQYYIIVGQNYSSADAACSAYKDYRVSLKAAESSGRYTGVVGSVLLCDGVYNSTAHVVRIQLDYKDSQQSNAARTEVVTVGMNATTAMCPANSTAVTDGCQCAATFDEVGGQCLPHTNKCSGAQGKTGALNWTEGFTRTPDEGDRSAVGGVYSPPRSGNVCMGGCAVSLQLSGPGVQPLVSQSPTAQGLYRRSVDYPYLGLGTECTQGTADIGADKSVAPPDCPGTVGEYSGKPACFGTAAKPVTPTPLGQPAGAAIAGNPKAGDKPSTGEGSGTGSAGRTPSSGNGDAEGGPSGAAVGGKGGDGGGTTTGSGTTPKPADGQEQAACGAPGQPECSVKVNEKGTPDGAGTTYDTAKAKIDETKGKNDEQLQKAAGSGDKGFFEPIRSLFWAPPVAACETFDLPQQVGGLKLDACGVVDGVRNAMALVWAGTGLFLCFGMIKRSF